MKRRPYPLALLGSLSIVVDSLAFSFTAGYLNPERQSQSLEWFQWAAGLVVSWPLVALHQFFGASVPSASPGVLLCLLVFDLAIYSLPIYALLRWLHRRRTGS